MARKEKQPLTIALEKFWLAHPDDEHPTAVAYLQKHGFENEDEEYLLKRSHAVRWLLNKAGKLRAARSKLTKTRNAKKNGKANGLDDPRLTAASRWLRQWWLKHLHRGTHTEAMDACIAAGHDPELVESHRSKSWAARQPVPRRIKPIRDDAPEATPASASPTVDDRIVAPSSDVNVVDLSGLTTGEIIAHGERMLGTATSLQQTAPIEAAAALVSAKRMIDEAVERRTAALIEA